MRDEMAKIILAKMDCVLEDHLGKCTRCKDHSKDAANQILALEVPGWVVKVCKRQPDGNGEFGGSICIKCADAIEGNMGLECIESHPATFQEVIDSKAVKE